MKVYVVVNHWQYNWEHSADIVGVFTNEEDALNCLMNFAENNIKDSFKEDDCWYNETHTMFTAYNEKTSDEENLEIVEKELNDYDYNQQ